MKPPITRHTIGTVTTKDIELYKRYHNIKDNHTMESIFRRGMEELEQESIDSMKQNNIA